MNKAIVAAAALGLAACQPADSNTAAEETEGSNATAVVESFYAAAAAGDAEAIGALLGDDAVWNEAESSPFASGNPYVGAEAVAGGVFGAIGAAYADFAGVPERFTTEGNRVVVEGRYTGTNNATGEPLDAQFVHVFTVDGETIESFQQYTDTYQWRRTSGTLEE